MHVLSQTHPGTLRSWTIVRALVSLTKPVAVGMIVLVTGIGMSLAERVATSGAPILLHKGTLILTCLLVGLSSAGAFALNQYYERNLDRLMARARDRALPSGRLNPSLALGFGLSFFFFPLVGLFFWSSPACAWLTALCGVMYVWVYTPLKTRSSLSTFAGAVPGALLPLMGWYAVRSDLSINVLFPTALLFIWQIPHALIIALRHLDDYRAAGMKQLPILLGERAGRLHIFFSSTMTAILCLAPTIWVSNSLAYGVGTVLIQGTTFIFALRAFSQGSKSEMGVFFAIHLLSLPAQLGLFLILFK